MNCDKCRYYLRRELTQNEAQAVKAWRMQGQYIMFDTRFCCLGGCDGSRFEPYKEEV